jgi:phosphocarrier protein
MLSQKIHLDLPDMLNTSSMVKLIDICKQSRSKIKLRKGPESADPCSYLQVLSICASKGNELEIIAEGGDEQLAVKAIADVFEMGYGA